MCSLLLLEFDFCNIKELFLLVIRGLAHNSLDYFILGSDVQIIRIIYLFYADTYSKFQCIYLDHKEFDSYKYSCFSDEDHKCYKKYLKCR